MLKKKIIIDKANRLYQMAPGVLSLMRAERRKPLLKRVELLDLATFSWPVEYDSDMHLKAGALEPASRERISELKEAVAEWLGAHHKVKVNPEREVFVGGRISSLMFGLALSYIEHGDIAFVPDVGIPLYRRVITACSGEPVGYPLNARNDWLPDFDRLSTNLGRVSRVLFVNTPHNPTGAELSEKEMSHLVWTAARENVLVVNDAAYQSVSSRLPVSLLSVPGGKQVGVEAYSFSYLLGLPPLPFGFVAGNREAVGALKLASELMPAFIPDFYVDLALHGLRTFPSHNLKQLRNMFEETSAEAAALLNKLYLEKAGQTTVPFLWARIERRRHSGTAARLLYRRSRILVAPGTGFGESGQGYLRFSLTAGPESYRKAAARLKRKMRLFQTKDDE